MLRNALLYLSHQQQVFRFVRGNPIAKQFASRFVAGETIDAAVDAVAALNAKGITASLDLLGESVTNAEEARETGREYERLLDRIAERRLKANVSVKLTAMGQDIDEGLCLDTIGRVLDRARAHGNFVRLDMESSAYTQKTLDLFYDKLYPQYREHVGIVLQSYLYRTDDDVARAVAERCRVRICKGAYKEPPEVAYPEKADVDRSYVRAMQALMRDGKYPGLATHDEAIIEEAKRFAKAEGIDRDRFEFQMLYGVRRDLQEQLVREGYHVRCYVPFGTSWYPYLMRRLAERPANVAFMTGNIVKELMGGASANGAGSSAAPDGRAFTSDGVPDDQVRRDLEQATVGAGAGADVAGPGAGGR